MKIFLDLQNSMRAVTLNSEFSLCGLIVLLWYEEWRMCKRKWNLIVVHAMLVY